MQIAEFHAPKAAEQSTVLSTSVCDGLFLAAKAALEREIREEKQKREANVQNLQMQSSAHGQFSVISLR